MKTIPTVEQLAGIILQTFEEQNIPFVFAPNRSMSDLSALETFQGSSYDRARIILKWYHKEFLKKEFPVKKNLWDFAKQLQEVLPTVINAKFEGSLDLQDYLQHIDLCPLITKEMIAEEEKGRSEKRSTSIPSEVGVGIRVDHEEKEDFDSIYRSRFNQKSRRRTRRGN